MFNVVEEGLRYLLWRQSVCLVKGSRLGIWVELENEMGWVENYRQIFYKISCKYTKKYKGQLALLNSTYVTLHFRSIH